MVSQRAKDNSDSEPCGLKMQSATEL
ncbi:hypothetical protein HaLaN_16871, partial [Haematococcus lacustris]